MEVWLTRGMFGERQSRIADCVKTGAEALSALDGWKQSEAARESYKVEQYNRFIFGADGVAVDFGDYMSFILISGPDARSEISGALYGKEAE